MSPDDREFAAIMAGGRALEDERVMLGPAWMAAAPLADDDEITVIDVLRERAATRGISLAHVPDRELGERLAAMPLRLTDDLDAAATWLVYGTADGPSDEGRATGSGPPRPGRSG